MLQKYGLSITAVTFLGAYSLATLEQWSLLSYILAPMGSWAAAIMLFYVLRHAERLHPIWFTLGIGLVSFGLADAAWAWCVLHLRIDPEGQGLIDGLYLLTNLTIAIAAGMLLRQVTRRLNKVQLLLDVAAISVSSLSFFWIVIMQSRPEAFVNSSNEILVLNMAADFFVLVTIAMWALSVRVRAINRAVIMYLAGSVIYASIDLVWAYMYFYDLYLKNTPIDAVYIAAMFLLAWSGLTSLGHNGEGWAQSFYQKITVVGPRRIGWLLLFFPLCMVAVDGWEFHNFGWLLGIFGVYQILSSYVQNGVKSQLLRQNEQDLARIRQVEIEAHQDPLTNLANRRYLMDRLVQYCSDYQRCGREFAVLFLDIDGFKPINDSFGHNIGDRLLMEIAAKLRLSVRKQDQVARLGGDEFVVVVEEYRDATEMGILEQRLRSIFARPFHIEGCLCPVGISIGFSSCPLDGVEAEELLRAADQRMYHEKQTRQRAAISGAPAGDGYAGGKMT